MSYWIPLLLLALAPSALARCSCLCIDGSPRTLCTDVVDAQQNPSLCGASAQAACPTLPVSESGEREHYASPVADGVNCREVRVWDPASEGYTTVKVCDVLPAGS